MKLSLNSDRKKTPDVAEYRNMTKEELLALTYNDHPQVILRNGRVGNVKINGAVRTWKRDPNRVEIPVKYGMYECYTFSLDEALSRFVVQVS